MNNKYVLFTDTVKYENSNPLDSNGLQMTEGSSVAYRGHRLTIEAIDCTGFGTAILSSGEVAALANLTISI